MTTRYFRIEMQVCQQQNNIIFTIKVIKETIFLHLMRLRKIRREQEGLISVSSTDRGKGRVKKVYFLVI